MWVTGCFMVSSIQILDLIGILIANGILPPRYLSHVNSFFYKSIHVTIRNRSAFFLKIVLNPCSETICFTMVVYYIGLYQVFLFVLHYCILCSLYQKDIELLYSSYLTSLHFLIYFHKHKCDFVNQFVDLIHITNLSNYVKIQGFHKVPSNFFKTFLCASGKYIKCGWSTWMFHLNIFWEQFLLH